MKKRKDIAVFFAIALLGIAIIGEIAESHASHPHVPEPQYDTRQTLQSAYAGTASILSPSPSPSPPPMGTS